MTSERARVVRELAGFKLLKELGQGGMGKVFLARQTSLDRLVALKVLPPELNADLEFVQRFDREAKAAALFQHPHVVSVYDQGQDPVSGVRFIAFEYVDGGSLENLLRTRGALPEREALTIGRAVAMALEYAESKGVVHRDVKPDNILLTRAGVPKLADLGLAKQAGAPGAKHVTQTGAVLGTPLYMAPEQALGEPDLDVRADLYALGLCLWRALTGVVPFDEDRSSNAVQILTRHIHHDLPDVRTRAPAVSEGAAKVIAWLAARDRDDRYPSARQAVLDLNRVLAGQPPLGPKDPSSDTTVLHGSEEEKALQAERAAARRASGAHARPSSGRLAAPAPAPTPRPSTPPRAVVALVLVAAVLVGVGLALAARRPTTVVDVDPSSPVVATPPPVVTTTAAPAPPPTPLTPAPAPLEPPATPTGTDAAVGPQAVVDVAPSTEAPRPDPAPPTPNPAPSDPAPSTPDLDAPSSDTDVPKGALPAFAAARRAVTDMTTALHGDPDDLGARWRAAREELRRARPSRGPHGAQAVERFVAAFDALVALVEAPPEARAARREALAQALAQVPGPDFRLAQQPLFARMRAVQEALGTIDELLASTSSSRRHELVSRTERSAELHAIAAWLAHRCDQADQVPGSDASRAPEPGDSVLWRLVDATDLEATLRHLGDGKDWGCATAVARTMLTRGDRPRSSFLAARLEVVPPSSTGRSLGSARGLLLVPSRPLQGDDQIEVVVDSHPVVIAPDHLLVGGKRAKAPRWSERPAIVVEAGDRRPTLVSLDRRTGEIVAAERVSIPGRGRFLSIKYGSTVGLDAVALLYPHRDGDDGPR